jgi:hypothetical protein
MTRLFFVSLGLLVFCSHTALAQERIISKYTSTARAKAIKFEEHNEEPGGGFRGLFAGFGDYQLEHLAGDDRSWINIRYRNKTVDLYVATMEAAGGAFPQKANDVVEWRGVEKNGRFTPFAVIYRIEYGDGESSKVRTRLLVIKLDGARSRIIGHAQGADEDAEAKAIADSSR